MVRMFPRGSGEQGSIPNQVISKTQKWYLIPPCLTRSIIRYGSRVSGAIHELQPPLHLGVVSIVERVLGSPSTTVNLQQLTYMCVKPLIP